MSTGNGDAPVKKPFGRPSEYKPEYCQLIIDHMAKGYSFEACAGKIGVDKITLYRWVKAHPDFCHAKAIAFERSRDFWETIAIDNVVNTSESGYDELGNKVSKSKSLNSAAWIFNMKNRFGWRDRVEFNQPERFVGLAASVNHPSHRVSRRMPV